MKRLILLAATCGILVACGSASSTSIVLRPNEMLPTAVYLKVTGPAAAAKLVARTLSQDGGPNGLLPAPAVQGKQACARAIPLVAYPVTGPSLRSLGGQKVTVAIFGAGQYATASCQALPTAFPHGFPLIGGNRRLYRQPSSSMEPTLHCARPAPGCLGHTADQLLVPLTGARGLRRGSIAVFDAPMAAATACGAGGTFIKRVIGLPGEIVREDAHGFIWIRGHGSSAWRKLEEPYVSAQARKLDAGHGSHEWTVRTGSYFVLGDNRPQSCDSRRWGPVRASYIIGPVVQVLRDGAMLRPAGIPR
jgi:signal peptidase I